MHKGHGALPCRLSKPAYAPCRTPSRRVQLIVRGSDAAAEEKRALNATWCGVVRWARAAMRKRVKKSAGERAFSKDSRALRPNQSLASGTGALGRRYGPDCAHIFAYS
ncbi:hypothetical protein MRX96_040907 [Rhipicephalus microplus]